MEIIRRYFPDLTDRQNEQLTKLLPLYTSWNKKINVISRKDIDQLYSRHVLHSLVIAKYIRFKADTQILDAGTGGGFPGIPLAIVFPQVNFTLVDSIGKKIHVVNEVVSELKLKNCQALQVRAEQVDKKFDFIVSRAVTTLPGFIPWVADKILDVNKNPLPNGILALKGGDIREELNIPYQTKVVSVSEFFGESFFESKKLVHVYISSKLQGS